MHSRARSFQVGERVYVKNFIGNPLWLEGEILDQTGPVSLSDGRIRKRHVDHIRIRYPKDGSGREELEVLEGPASFPTSPADS